MRTTRLRRWGLRLVGLSAAGLMCLSGTFTSSAVGAAPGSSGTWLYPNGDLANTRDAVGSTINVSNVASLKLAWSFKLKGSGAKLVSGLGTLAATPIVVDGAVYLQDLHSNVYALSLATGKLKWEFVENKPLKSGPGPNGVAVVNGVVYGAAPKSVFALNASTGKKIWVNKTLLKKGQGTIGIQPQVADGRVYLASQYGSGPGGGVLLALNAATGAVEWRFNSVLHNDQSVTSAGLGAGGAWETPLVSPDGSVTFGIGNPYQSPQSAIDSPSKLLYTDSDVNLNAATGKLNWYYQGVPNDFKDYDMQASPISTSADGVPVVLGGGKMGYVYEMNAATGKLLWKTPVGEHNGHDDDSLKALHHKLQLTAPFTILPGSLGGILTNMAVAGGSVYVVTGDVPITSTSLTQVLGTKPGALDGEIEALNLVTGKVEWDTKVKGLPVGAATVSNNVVLTTLFQGELLALDATTGKVVLKQGLPNTTNSTIAVAGNTVLVPAGGPKYKSKGGVSQVDAYTVGSAEAG